MPLSTPLFLQLTVSAVSNLRSQSFALFNITLLAGIGVGIVVTDFLQNLPSLGHGNLQQPNGKRSFLEFILFNLILTIPSLTVFCIYPQLILIISLWQINYIRAAKPLFPFPLVMPVICFIFFNSSNDFSS